ncbi:MAG: AraC family transcriptional regulator [Microcoleaceae cyanobacterium]
MVISSSKTPSPIVSSQDLGWESITVEEFEQPPGSGEFEPETEHILTLCLAPKPLRIWQSIGEQKYSGIYSKGDIAITPATQSSAYQADGEDRYLQIGISPQFLKQVATETINSDPDKLELSAEFRARNLQIEQLAMMLRAEIDRGKNGMGQLYIDSLANAITVNILRNYTVNKPKIAVYKGGLSDRQILQITDYINHHLSDSLKIQDLAAYLGISKFHFSRLFKKSTGISPHQYVMQQRIELAKQLLAKENLSILNIALECGFNSHAHLGKYFCTSTGMSPKAYRQTKAKI